MNELAVRLLARGYQIKKDTDQIQKWVLQLFALPVNVAGHARSPRVRLVRN